MTDAMLNSVDRDLRLTGQMHLFDHALKSGQVAGELVQAVALGSSLPQRDELLRQRRLRSGFLLG